MHRVVASLLLVLAGMAACERSKPPRNLDPDAIRVTSAQIRTDTVGDGKFAELATFVLVDAENTSGTGAYVTLGGNLDNEQKQHVCELKAQSLWIPPHETRTFALVDLERKPRPTANGAHITVRGALIPDSPPAAHVADLKSIDDYGKIVVQGTLVNEANRPGEVMVIASFHDEQGRPMTRPFTMVKIDANGKLPLQFVGPQNSKTGTIFIGDVIF